MREVLHQRLVLDHIQRRLTGGPPTAVDPREVRLSNKGPRPKPTHLRLVLGNPSRRPLNSDEPKPDPKLLKAPDELGADAKIEWRRMAVQLYNLGLLTGLDRAALAAYCTSYGRWITAERALAKQAERDPQTQALLVMTKKGNVIQNPLVGTANKAMAAMVHYAAEFGMTPSARSRIKAESPRGQVDPTAKYF
jgi:P27 family predicted phage terminase small subunit